MSVDRRNIGMTWFQILFSLILLAVGHGAGLARAQAQPQNSPDAKNVLVLHAFESNVPVFEMTDRAIRKALDAGGIGIRNQFFEYLDLARNPGAEYREHLAELMRLRCGRRTIDIIITLYPEALRFALEEGGAVFSGAPIISLYLPPGFEPPKTGRRIIRQIFELDLMGTLETALEVVSGAKHVYVVSGAHELERKYEDEARRSFKAWEGQLKFRYLSDLSLEAILDTVSTAPPKTIVLLIGFAKDVTGKNYTTREVGERLSRVSRAPVFGLLQVLLGYGIAGGRLVSFEHIGSKAGELALDIFKGARTPENIPEFLDVPAVPMFDWRQLRHWNLREDALPEGSIVINRETTFWDFKYHILGALVLIIGQSLLIARLMIQRRRRRSAEVSLTRAEEKYRNIFDSALEGIYETSPQGQLLTANRALARMLGYDSPEEVISSIRDTASQLWADPDGRADYVRLLDEQNVVRGFECRFLRKDGTKFWVSLNTRRVTGPDGQTLLYSGFLEDIAVRKQAVEALKERLNFEMLLAEISALFVNLPADRIDSEIEAAQRRVCDLLDLDRSSLFQVLGEQPETMLLTHFYQPAGSRMPPERMSLNELFPWVLPQILDGETITISKMTDLPADAARDRETFSLYGTRSTVVAPLAVGGSGVFGLLSFAVMREEREWTETVVQGFQLIAQVFANALARKNTEVSLRRKTEELDQFFSVSLDLLCIANTAGFFLRLNPAWERVLGYSRQELMAGRFLDFIHPDDLAGTRQAVSGLASQQEVIHFENRYRCKDGTYRWLEWTSAAAGEMIYAAARDASARKQGEAALKERLGFEELLADLSARFVNMPSDQVDAEIEDGLKQVLEFFQVDRCALLRLLPAKTSFQISHIASLDNVPPVPTGVELPRALYPWTYAKLADQHEVLSIARLDDLPAAANIDRQTCVEWGIRSFVNIPILIGGSADHIFNVNSVKRERVWPEELLPRLRLLGEIFVNALLRKQAETAARESERRLRENESDLRGLAGRLIYAQEEERSRLARELHDDLVQRLAVVAIDAGRLELQLTDPPPPVRQALAEMKTGIVGISQDVHGLSRRLHPSILDDLGLIKAVESECAGFAKREGIEVVFSHENIPRLIARDVALALYRIIQEGLRNIAKHACADHISVSLKGTDNEALLSVQDDGLGFDSAEVRGKPGLGLSSIRERVRLIQGKLSIKSQPETGTLITVRAPLQREER